MSQTYSYNYIMAMDPPSLCQPLDPFGLHQRHLEHALDRLINLAGPPAGQVPAVAFLVGDPDLRPPARDGLKWVAVVGVPRQGTRPFRLLLGGWTSGSFQIPIEAPGRNLPGRCPLDMVLDGSLGRRIFLTHRCALTCWTEDLSCVGPAKSDQAGSGETR